MSPHQELSAAVDTPMVFLEPGQRRAELFADIVAVSQTTSGGFDPMVFQTLPTVLRRLATLLAEALPERLDRLVTSELTGVAVTTALALHTGLPFAAARASDSATWFDGSVQRGEQVAVVEPILTDEARIARIVDQIHTAGAHAVAVLAVIDQVGVPVVSNVPVNALFHLTGDPVSTTV